MGEDEGPYNAGPLWIWTYMNYTEAVDEKGRFYTSVRAPMMKTPDVYYI
jgi:hypothetical protein